jgi:glycosyltransferase involved in cell wall biosynthesis
MKKNPRFTIITPAYQTEPFIDKMAESLKAQTFTDFECILVVEESKDRSLERCQAISRGDDRFTAVSLPKSGSGSSPRNYGIREAKGEYIVFVDGDDWIEPKSLELFAKTIDDLGGLDVLLTSGKEMYQKEDGSFQVTRRISNISKADEGKVVTGRQMIVKVGRAQNYLVLNVCRTEFLRAHELYFVDGLQQEDTEWTPRVWFYAERVGALDFEFYNYRRWGGSVQSSCSPKLLVDFSKIVNIQFDFHDTHNIPEDVLNVWRNQWVSMIYWYFFNPQYVVKFERDVRIKALDNVMGNESKWERFRKIAEHTSLPKRLAIPLVERAAKKHAFRWADAYFRFFYFPLVRMIMK